MPEILARLQNLASLLEPTTLQHLAHVLYGMLISNGRLTMLEISRWTTDGGSYRTIQRLYPTPLVWLQIQWLWFSRQLHRPTHEYIAVGDEVVVGKVGTQTHGVGRFFASLQQRVMPSLSFFTFALVNVQERQAYPIHTVQTVKPAPRPAHPTALPPPSARAPKRKVGRPKGSKNKPGAAPQLNAELLRLQPVLQAFLAVLLEVIRVRYLVLDGHFGNAPSAWLVLQAGLQFISKLRHDAALYEPFTGAYGGRGRRRKYGAKIVPRGMPRKYLKSELTYQGVCTQVYQATLLHPEFAMPLNVVVLVKTRVATGQQAHVLFFSTDLALAADKIMDYYSLRFQIEFTFRDAKQYWGLEDFMNVKETAVTNAANLAFFMVNFSAVLLRQQRATQPDFSVQDLKALYRGQRYALETIKWLPQKPEGILLEEILAHIAQLGRIHPDSASVSTA